MLTVAFSPVHTCDYSRLVADFGHYSRRKRRLLPKIGVFRLIQIHVLTLITRQHVCKENGHRNRRAAAHTRRTELQTKRRLETGLHKLHNSLHSYR